MVTKHIFVSAKADSPDATLILPQRDWNDDHVGSNDAILVGPDDINNYITDGGADEVQINQAIVSAAHKDTVRLQTNKTFTLADEILINGLGVSGGPDPVDQLSLLGGGKSTVLTQGAANKNAVVVKNYAYVDVGKFKIVEPSASSGHGLFLDKTGAAELCSCENSFFHEIYSVGCDATHYPIYLLNPFWSEFRNLWGRSGVANAMYLANDDAAVNYGNNLFTNTVLYSPAGKTALTLEGINKEVMLNTLIHTEIVCPGAAIKLRGDVSYNNFLALDLEPAQTGILFDPNTKLQRGNYFQGGIRIEANQTGIDASGTAGCIGGNKFDVGISNVATGVGNYVLKDNVGWQPRNEYDLRFPSTQITPNLFSITGPSVYGLPLIRYHAVYFKNPSSGIAAAVNDGGTIDHLLGNIPTEASVNGSVASEIVTITSVDVDHITVAIKKRSDGSAGTAQSIYWKAGFYSG